MLEIFHNLLISLLLACRRLGLLVRCVAQEFGSGWVCSVSQRFHSVRSQFGCYAAVPLKGWRRDGSNLPPADLSWQQQLWLPLSRDSQVVEVPPCYASVFVSRRR